MPAMKRAGVKPSAFAKVSPAIAAQVIALTTRLACWNYYPTAHVGIVTVRNGKHQPDATGEISATLDIPARSSS
jgi:hypothetical protein